MYALLLVAKIDPLCDFLFLDSRVLGGLPNLKGVVGFMIFININPQKASLINFIPNLKKDGKLFLAIFE